MKICFQMLELITVDLLYQFLTISIFGQFKSMNALKGSDSNIYKQSFKDSASIQRLNVTCLFF